MKIGATAVPTNVLQGMIVLNTGRIFGLPPAVSRAARRQRYHRFQCDVRRLFKYGA